MQPLYELLSVLLLASSALSQQRRSLNQQISRARATPFANAVAGQREPRRAKRPVVDPAECPVEPPTECKAAPRALDEECQKDKDCVVPGVCKDGRCGCPEDYVRRDYYCVRAPSYGEACRAGVCKAPYECTQGKFCDCPANMARTYFGCELECARGEVATPTKCLKLAALGERCSSTLQCQVAYSECGKAGRCSCVAGALEYLGKECLPTYRCPNGDPPMKDPDSPFLLECRASTCPLEGAKPDTCPEGAHCVFPSYQNTQGFCCSSAAWCPAGAPLAGAKCEEPSSQAERCPPDTHHCYTGERGTYCCPLPCPAIVGKPAVIVNGTCYAKRALKEECDQSLQCPQGALCGLQDEDFGQPKCYCPKGTRQHFGSQGTICRKVCDGSEVLVGDECLSVAAPLQPCRHSAQCVGGTKCVEGQCRCDCGLYLYYGRCVTRPNCRVYGAYSGDKAPLRDVNGEFLECSPGQKRRDNSCPDDAYCRQASLYSGGVCCPMPTAHCDDGTEPLNKEECNVRRAGQCAQGEYCRDFFSESIEDAGEVLPRWEAGACCPHRSRASDRPVRRTAPPATQRRRAALKLSRASSHLYPFYGDYGGVLLR